MDLHPWFLPVLPSLPHQAYKWQEGEDACGGGVLSEIKHPGDS